VAEIIVLSPQKDEDYARICGEYDARLVDDGSRQDGKRVKSLWQVLNSGIEIALGSHVCWLNDDCTVLPGWDRAVLSTFEKPECGIVSLKTRHVGEYTDRFILIPTLYGTICANYGVIVKADGIRFDEKFSWFHGDADIALQAEFLYQKRVYGTEEPCVVHEHFQDHVRAGNESDPRSQADWIYLNRKWRGFCRVGSLQLRGVPARVLNSARDMAGKPGLFWEKMIVKKLGLQSRK
jgi:hypothetical protein